MKVESQKKTFNAWQHKFNTASDDNTNTWPGFIIELAKLEQIREMPDGSLHITDESGRVMPVPLDYWVLQNDADQSIQVVAPDRFKVEFAEV